MDIVLFGYRLPLGRGFARHPRQTRSASRQWSGLFCGVAELLRTEEAHDVPHSIQAM